MDLRHINTFMPVLSYEWKIIFILILGVQLFLLRKSLYVIALIDTQWLRLLHLNIHRFERTTFTFFATAVI